MIPLRQFPFESKVMVVAHRGDSGHAPENTLAAFRGAIDSGADMIELDIQCTRDRQLVVFHDSTLRRTTNGTGYLARKTYAELSHLDAGNWFDKKFSGERIPTLDEVLDVVKNKIYVNIEIKPNAARTGVAPLVIAALHRHHMEHYVLISSFHHGVVKKIKETAPELATAIIQHPGATLRSPVPAARRAHADAIVCAVRQLSRARCAAARAYNMPMCCYTVNSQRALAKALRCGANAIVTNFPAEIVAKLQKHAAKSH